MNDDYLMNVDQLDKEAMEEIVREYWSDIRNYAFYMTKKHDLADDIAQDTFIAAFRTIDRFRGQSSIKTWLLRICHNRVQNVWKSALFRKMISVAKIHSNAIHDSAEATFFKEVIIEDIIRDLLSIRKNRNGFRKWAFVGMAVFALVTLLSINSFEWQERSVPAITVSGDLLYKEQWGEQGELSFTRTVNSEFKTMEWTVAYEKNTKEDLSPMIGGTLEIKLISRSELEAKRGIDYMLIPYQEATPFPLVFGDVTNPFVTKIRVVGTSNTIQATLVRNASGGHSLWFAFLPSNTDSNYTIQCMDYEGNVIESRSLSLDKN